MLILVFSNSVIYCFNNNNNSFRNWIFQNFTINIHYNHFKSRIIYQNIRSLHNLSNQQFDSRLGFQDEVYISHSIFLRISSSQDGSAIYSEKTLHLLETKFEYCSNQKSGTIAVFSDIYCSSTTIISCSAKEASGIILRKDKMKDNEFQITQLNKTTISFCQSEEEATYRQLQNSVHTLMNEVNVTYVTSGITNSFLLDDGNHSFSRMFFSSNYGGLYCSGISTNHLRSFYLSLSIFHNLSRNVAQDFGGIAICIRSSAPYEIVTDSIFIITEEQANKLPSILNSGQYQMQIIGCCFLQASTYEQRADIEYQRYCGCFYEADCILPYQFLIHDERKNYQYAFHLSILSKYFIRSFVQRILLLIFVLEIFVFFLMSRFHSKQKIMKSLMLKLEL